MYQIWGVVTRYLCPWFVMMSVFIKLCSPSIDHPCSLFIGISLYLPSLCASVSLCFYHSPSLSLSLSLSLYIYIYSAYVAEVVSILPRECSTQCCGAFDKNVFKTTRSFRYQWFRVSTHQANANEPFIFSHMKRATGGGHLENAWNHLPLRVLR